MLLEQSCDIFSFSYLSTPRLKINVSAYLFYFLEYRFMLKLFSSLTCNPPLTDLHINNFHTVTVE